MKKQFLTISSLLGVLAIMGFVLARNKAKIDEAAKPVKDNLVIPVQSVTASIDSFNTAYTINGTTAPAREVNLASEVQGKLVNLFIENGDQVHAGEVIATLDASVYSVQLQSIDASIAKAQLDLSRYAKLIEMGGATPMQAEAAQLQINSLIAERKDLLDRMDHLIIRAPFSGTVENVTVEKGSFVSFGTVLGQLIDNSKLKMEVYLSEQQAFKVQKGQVVSIHSAVLAEPKTGIVNMISEKADLSGKFMTEISFQNSAGEKLKAGMIADIHFSTEAIETGLSIPVSALVGSPKEGKIYIANGNRAELRKVKAGIVTDKKVQVLEGLKEGEKVIVSGQINLENGTAISLNN